MAQPDKGLAVRQRALRAGDEGAEGQDVSEVRRRRKGPPGGRQAPPPHWQDPARGDDVDGGAHAGEGALADHNGEAEAAVVYEPERHVVLAEQPRV